MVSLLKMGKAAKSERLRKESFANKSITDKMEKWKETRAGKLMFSKQVHVDYAFTKEDTMEVTRKLAEWAFKYQVSGVRVVGVGGLNGFIQTRMSPSELRDQVQRAFSYCLTAKELGALIVMMLNHEYKVREAVMSSSPLPSTLHMSNRRRAKTVPLNGSRMLSGSSHKGGGGGGGGGGDGGQRGVGVRDDGFGHFDDADDDDKDDADETNTVESSAGFSKISVSEVDQWERKAALFQHACLRQVIEEKGDVILNASSFVALMRMVIPLFLCDCFAFLAKKKSIFMMFTLKIYIYIYIYVCFKN
jgi:hypothetical protein